MMVLMHLHQSRTRRASNQRGEEFFRLGSEPGAPPTLIIQRGDITKWRGDAIVNAANESLLGGSGVDGAIHRAAGPALYELCRQIPTVGGVSGGGGGWWSGGGGVRCPTGDARTTRAAGLAKNVRAIIHTVGPIYSSTGHDRSCALLDESCYRESVKRAKAHNMQTIAFPAISCGIFRFPVELAAEIALWTLADEAVGLSEVHFVLFDNETHAAWCRAAVELQSLLSSPPAPSGAPPPPPAGNEADDYYYWW